jgi:hypothetical protein
MALVDLIEHPQISAELDKLLLRAPAPPRQIAVAPHRNAGGLIGTAFTYALGFEILRRNQGATMPLWVAETALAQLEARLVSNREISDELNVHVTTFDEHHRALDAAEARKWRRVISRARVDQLRFARRQRPSIRTRTAMARHALRLAKIDPYYRKGLIDATVEDKPRAEDEEDIVALVDVAPPVFFTSTPTIVGVDFPTVGTAIGGADADLLLGDLLVEVKTVKRANLLHDARQLVAYLVLDSLMGSPRCRRGALYYSRHAKLVELALVPDFAKRASKIFKLMCDAHRKRR